MVVYVLGASKSKEQLRKRILWFEEKKLSIKIPVGSPGLKSIANCALRQIPVPKEWWRGQKVGDSLHLLSAQKGHPDKGTIQHRPGLTDDGQISGWDRRDPSTSPRNIHIPLSHSFSRPSLYSTHHLHSLYALLLVFTFLSSLPPSLIALTFRGLLSSLPPSLITLTFRGHISVVFYFLPAFQYHCPDSHASKAR